MSGLVLEIPGLMARGNWKAAAYIDERASYAAYEALIKIFSGQAKGTTGLFKVLVSEFLGAERAPVEFTTEGNARRLMVGKVIQGEVVPVPGHKGEEIVVKNTEYWMGPDITVATCNQGSCTCPWPCVGFRWPLCRDLSNRLAWSHAKPSLH
jgi:hypothetical protein